MNLGDNIRNFREKRGLTRIELANKIDVHSSALANYEYSNRLPSINTLIDIADVLHVSLDALCGREHNDVLFTNINLEHPYAILLKNKLTKEQESEILKIIQNKDE